MTYWELVYERTGRVTSFARWRQVLSAILVHWLLRTHGWRPCELADGAKGWERPNPATGNMVRGDTEAAIRLCWFPRKKYRLTDA